MGDCITIQKILSMTCQNKDLHLIVIVIVLLRKSSTVFMQDIDFKNVRWFLDYFSRD